MPKKQKIYKLCGTCGGAGTVTTGDGLGPATSVTCPQCKGEKHAEWGFVKLVEEDT